VICALQLTDEDKVRWFYSLKINDFSSRSLVGIFEKHFSAGAKEMGVKVEERFLRVTELKDSLRSGTLQEAFGTGTAATIAYISKIHINGRDYVLPEIKEDSFSSKILKTLDAIKYGKIEDTHGWIMKIK